MKLPLSGWPEIGAHVFSKNTADRFFEALGNAALMASLVFFLHEWTPVVEVVDDVSLLLVSAMSQRAGGARSGSTVVIGIDQLTYEETFHDRSPLDRCAMAEQLQSIYDAHPSLVVIDIDISPSIAGVSLPEDPLQDVKCELQLYETITNQQRFDKDGKRPVNTVILKPFPVSDTNATNKKISWCKTMIEKGVAFGDGFMPIRLGITQRYTDHALSIAHVAKRAGSSRGGVVPKGTAKNCDAAWNEVEFEHKREPINFLAFTKQSESMTWKGWKEKGADIAGKVVFYGANYGEDDRYLTPVDKLYGVNLHAAAFISIDNEIKTKNVWGIVIDTITGLGFTFVAAFFWERYLEEKSHVGNPVRRELAFCFLIALAVLLIPLMWAAAALSVYLVSAHNIWISPLPMAIGMTLEAFVLGAVHAMDHPGPPVTAETYNPYKQIKLIFKLTVILLAVLCAWIGCQKTIGEKNARENFINGPRHVTGAATRGISGRMRRPATDPECTGQRMEADIPVAARWRFR
jgi:CHASE2 domain-containing sensor protein